MTEAEALSLLELIFPTRRMDFLVNVDRCDEANTDVLSALVIGASKRWLVTHVQGGWLSYSLTRLGVRQIEAFRRTGRTC